MSKFQSSILVVEDNEVLQRVMARMLHNLGRSQAAVTTGEAACAACQESPFPLILMDLDLPGMGGIESARQIRAQNTAGQEPWIIAVTGMHKTAAEPYMGREFNDFLAKPVRLESLRQALLNADFGYTRAVNL